MPKHLTLYSDGGARGNPGPAAVAFLALDENGLPLKKGSKFLGIRTNNQAEYEALIAGLEYGLAEKFETVICHLDSELVGRQLKKEYKVRNPQLQLLYLKADKLLQGFKKYSIVNVHRTDVFIQKTDAMVNEILDKSSKKF